MSDLSKKLGLPEARDQRYRFAHRMLPMLAAKDAVQLMRILRSAPDRFLTDMWTVVGQDLPAEDRLVPDGLGCDIHESGGLTCAVITFPPPIAMTETFFTAVVLRTADIAGPTRSPFPRYRYFTLEFSPLRKPNGTMMGAWSPGGTHCNSGGGPEPTLSAFVEAAFARASSLDDDGDPRNWIACASCLQDFSIDTLPRAAVVALGRRDLYRRFARQAAMLERTRQLFERHPEAREAHQNQTLQRAESVRILEIATEGDAEMLSFLVDHHFGLEPRTTFVARRLEEYAAARDVCVPCPNCTDGALEVIAEFSDELQEAVPTR